MSEDEKLISAVSPATGGGLAAEFHSSGGAAYIGVSASGGGIDPDAINWREVYTARSPITTSLALASPISTRVDLASPLQ